jgi:hypothetical protein
MLHPHAGTLTMRCSNRCGNRVALASGELSEAGYICQRGGTDAVPQGRDLCGLQRKPNNPDRPRTESNVKIALGILVAGVLAPLSGQANDFPTQARVEYVLRCMDYHGGPAYETMYACVCSIDKIATKFSYDEYEAAEVLAQLQGFPGERGGMFRDPEGAEELAEKYVDVIEEAESSCFRSVRPSQGRQ